MKKNFKTLLCAAAILGSMSAGIVFADDLSIFEGQTVTNDTSSSYENVNNQGTLVNSAGLSISGSLNNASTVNNTSSITASAIMNATTINNDGTISITGTSFTNTGSILSSDSENLSGELTINGGANSGKISQKTFTNSGSFTNGGTIKADDFNNTGTIENWKDIVTSTITNDGTFNHNSGSLIANIIKNNNTFTNNSTVGASDSRAEITNNGTFTNNGTIYGSEITNNHGKDFTNNNEVNANKISNDGTYTNAKNTTASEIKNTGTISNSGTINASTSITNDGTINNGGTIKSALLTNNKDIHNDSTIEIDSLNNSTTASVIDGAGNLKIANGGANNGSITQTEITINTNANGSTFTNDGTITAGTLNNNSKMSGAGTIVANGGTNNGEISQKDVTLNGSYTNNGTIDSSGTFTNTANIGGSGNLFVKNGANTGNIVQKNFTAKEDGSFTNEAQITTAGTFTNSGSLTNNSDIITNNFIGNANSNLIGNGNLTINNNGTNARNIIQATITNKKSFKNTGSVTADTINNVAAANFTNEGTLTVGNLNNKGTLLNKGDFIASNNEITNDGNFINSGANASINTGTKIINNKVFGADNGAHITVDSITNNDTIQITNGSRIDINNQGADLGGKINVIKGENNLNITGSNNNIAGTLNIGNGQDNTVLELGNGNILSDATININQAGKLSVNNANSTVEINQGDTINGELSLVDGNINLDNYNFNSTVIHDGVSTDIKGPRYTQYGGTLSLANNSTLGVADLAYIQGGDINIDSTSKFVALSEAHDGIHHLDNLNTSGLFSAMNSDLADYNIDNINIGANTIGSTGNQADFTIDIYGRCNDPDKHGTDKFIGQNITGNGILNISDWKLAGDIFGYEAPLDRVLYLDDIFKFDNISDTVKLTATKKEVFTPIGWYQLNSRNGLAGSYTLNLTRLNPQVFRGQVATVAQWQNQLAIDDMLFNHSMVLPSFKDEDGGVAYSGVMVNRYAATNPVFAPYQYSRKDGGLWYKMYGTFEHLQMNNGLSRVGNNAYGALIGADFGLKELRNGWKFMPTAYIGYNGAHQYFAGMGNYQNGGQAGFLGTWYKDNFIIGGLVYGGVYENSMDIASHVDNTFNYFAGAATKMAYNWRFHRDWVLQPNLMAAYNFFGQQNWHTNYGQMGMMAGMLNGVNIAPGLNLIWEKETFSIYGTLQYMYNVNGAVGGQAGHVGLPQLEMQRGYIQYGLGFNKRFSDRFSGYLQAVLRNVGRTGVGFQMGFNILLGK